MPMIFRKCAGGVVFFGDSVFLLKNEKEEWVLPKGVIREKQLPNDVALERVQKEAGIKASIISPAGETSYEFYSMTPANRCAIRSPGMSCRLHRLNIASP
jgi:hypothetical protein